MITLSKKIMTKNIELLAPKLSGKSVIIDTQLAATWLRIPDNNTFAGLFAYHRNNDEGVFLVDFDSLKKAIDSSQDSDVVLDMSLLTKPITIPELTMDKCFSYSPGWNINLLDFDHEYREIAEKFIATDEKVQQWFNPEFKHLFLVSPKWGTAFFSEATPKPGAEPSKDDPHELLSPDQDD